MKLCVPLTDIFRRNQKEILPLVEAINYKSYSEEVFLGKDCFLESSLNIADPFFQDRIKASGVYDALRSGKYSCFACDIGPAYSSCHIEKSVSGYPRYIPDSSLMNYEMYLSQSEKNINYLRRHFNIRIKAENMNYFPGGAYEMVCEPIFISKLLRHLKVGLILDVGHLNITANNLNMLIGDYLGQLPMEMISEIHLNRSRTKKGILEDTHDVPTEKEYNLVKAITKKAKVEHITLEYYQQDDKFLRAYKELYRRFIKNDCN